MTEIGLDDNEYSSALEYLYATWLGPIHYPEIQRITKFTLRGSEVEENSRGLQTINWTIPIPTKMVLNGQTTLENDYLNWKNKGTDDRNLRIEDLDLNGFYSPLADCSAENLLTKEQKELIKNGDFAELGYTIESLTKTAKRAQKDRIKSIDYTMAKTIGYYRLMDSMANTTDPTNVYMFVMDSDAPHPVHDDSTDPTHLFTYNDIGMFKDMLKIELPEDWQSTINNAIETIPGINKKDLWDDCHDPDPEKTWTPETKWDFGTLVVSNLQWILSNNGRMRNPIPYQDK